MKRTILITLTALLVSTAINANETTPIIKETKTAQRFDYEADFAAFKTAMKAKDTETLDYYNKAKGTDTEMLLMYFGDPDFLKQLMSAKYEDLKESEFDGLPAVEITFSVSGSDEEGNEYESGVTLYFEESGSGLRLVDVLAAG